MKQHQSDRHQVTLTLDEARQQPARLHLGHSNRYHTSSAETVSIVSSSSSSESGSLLEAGKTNTKFGEFDALRTRVLVPLAGGRSVFLPK